MAKKGDVLVDPRFGERYVYLETAGETDGRLVRIEDTACPGGSRRPPSAHPHQEERFAVERGTLNLLVGGKEHLLGPGEEFVVPPGTRHLPRNAGESELRFVIEVRPAGRFEEFLEAITEVNRTGRRGLPYILTAAQVLHRFGDVEHPTTLPQPVEHALFGALAAAGRLFGYRTRAPTESKS